MNCCQNISIGVDFKKIPEMRVEPKASNGKGWIVVEKHDLLGITQIHEPTLDQVESLSKEEKRLKVKIMSKKVNDTNKKATAPAPSTSKSSSKARKSDSALKKEVKTENEKL